MAPELHLAAALAAAPALSLALDRLARPGAGLRGRAPGALAIQCGLLFLAFLPLVALTRRPFFALGLVAAAQLLVVLVSNAKLRALREPFVFSDFGLFSQALRHPRLYLPFLGLGPALAGASALALALWLGLALEPPLGGGGLAFAALMGAGLLGAASLLWLGRLATRDTLALEPEQDLRRLGLLPSVWLYWRAERGASRPPPVFTRYALPAAPMPVRPRTPPHIVVVQSESFFDVRRLHADIRAGVLARYDALRARAHARGRLTVPAWGANTMRTEFAFLSGIAPARLGVHRFNPYRRVARRPVPTIASCLRALGYRTVCIHPHPAAFFGRDRVFANLGFDAFIDLASFAGAPRAGPYVADAAVTAKIGEVLGAAAGPVFVFAITMENHGPLHLERPAAGEAERFYGDPTSSRGELTVYLRHLANADRMAGELAALLRQGRRPGVLAWYGDHVPSMPGVYEALGFEDARTDYLVWRTQGGGAGTCGDLAVEELGERVLAAAGLLSRARART